MTAYRIHSGLAGWERALIGASAAWAASVAADDIGPSREPMRARRLKRKEGDTNARSARPTRTAFQLQWRALPSVKVDLTPAAPAVPASELLADTRAA